MSSLKRLGRKEGSWVSYITSLQIGSVLSAQSGGGGTGSRELASGRSPSGPYFTDTPDRACCQERCLISSPDCRPDPPNKEGHCVRLPTLASAPQRSIRDAQRGFGG